MAKTKTHETAESVLKFIEEFADTEQKKIDSHELIEIMQKVTGFKAKMWGPSIIGFGNYHYKYESGHEGDAPLIGFSPRKAAISLYVFTGLPDHEKFLQDFGKFKMGKACIYIKKLSDIDTKKLETMMKETIKYLKQKHG